jgi:hypothetical protein
LAWCRFEIEENFLDDKSNGFQLESSLVREAEALTRLCFVVAVATLYLVAQGTQVVAAPPISTTRSTPLPPVRSSTAASQSGRSL